MTQVEFINAGGTLVSGSRDGTTRLWDVQRGEAKTSEEVARVQVGG